MQITEVLECHNKTVTRQSSSQRKSRCLSGKLHCLNFIFLAESETLGPVCLGCDHRCPFCCRCLRSLLKRQIHSYTPLVPLKTKLDSRPKRAKSRSLFRPKWRKSHTLGGGTHVYGLYRGVPSIGPACTSPAPWQFLANNNILDGTELTL